MKKNNYVVYFVGCRSKEGKHKAIKIGITNNTANRLADLQNGNHMPLDLIAWFEAGSRSKAMAIEREMHYQFRHLHIRGEWFYGGKNIAKYAAEMIHRFGLYPGRIDGDD